LRPLTIYLLIFITFCTSIDSNSYQIESVDGTDLITTRISIDIEKNRNGNVSISIQSFPKKADYIKNYNLVFDMKFREDYEGDFLGVCVGPSWEDFGPGEFSINLNNNNNFKNSISGKFLEDNDDGCDTYHYYVRYFELETIDGEVYLMGVATDYAEEYPDAPYIWRQNKNNDLEIIGTSNIEKYSLNFELSK
jgi:hypothetical protein